MVYKRSQGNIKLNPLRMKPEAYFCIPMYHAALAQGLATRVAFDEPFREHELPEPEADLPTAPASDLPTPSIIAEAEASEHAEIWRGSRAREFSGLLQAHTFGPA